MTSVTDLASFRRSLGFVEQHRDDPAFAVLVRRYLMVANGKIPAALSPRSLDTVIAVAGGSVVDDGSLPLMDAQKERELRFCKELLDTAQKSLTPPSNPTLYVSDWLRHQRKKQIAGELDQRFEDALTLLLPGWELTSKDTTVRKIVEVALFVRANGRLPWSDENPWLFSKRASPITSRAMKEHQGLLDELVPGWQEGPLTIFDEGVVRTKHFINEHGRLPNRKENDFLMRCKEKETKGRLSPTRKAILDETIPGWEQ